MALNKAALKAGIQSLAQDMADNEGSYSDFADGLADLIDAFVKTGTVTVPSGVVVSVAILTGLGATTLPGIGTIS
jgi:hypothetical protein